MTIVANFQFNADQLPGGYIYTVIGLFLLIIVMAQFVHTIV
jgi:predicted Zn-dependent protease